MGAIKSKFFRSKSGSRKNKGDKPEKGKDKKKVVNLPESQSARKTVDPRLPFSNYRQIFSIRNAWKPIQRAMEDSATETFIRFLTAHPNYRKKFSNVKGIEGDLEDLRKQQEFEDMAMNIYVIFDGVIANLETVDKALQEIKYGAPATQFSKKMVEAYQESFIHTIKLILGSDRFTENTENSFNLLYGYIREELCKYLDDEQEPEPVTVDNTQVEVNLCHEGDT